MAGGGSEAAGSSCTPGLSCIFWNMGTGCWTHCPCPLFVYANMAGHADATSPPDSPATQRLTSFTEQSPAFFLPLPCAVRPCCSALQAPGTGRLFLESPPWHQVPSLVEFHQHTPPPHTHTPMHCLSPSMLSMPGLHELGPCPGKRVLPAGCSGPAPGVPFCPHQLLYSSLLP